jgi:membrane protein DedA with SNARE-associated domain
MGAFFSFALTRYQLEKFHPLSAVGAANRCFLFGVVGHANGVRYAVAFHLANHSLQLFVLCRHGVNR